MNRNLADILLGKTAKAAPAKKTGEGGEKKEDTPKKAAAEKKEYTPKAEKPKAEKAQAEKARAERIREEDAELLEMERIAEEAEAKAKAEALVSGAAQAAEEMPADPDVFAADAEGLDWDAAEKAAGIAGEAEEYPVPEESAEAEEPAAGGAAETEDAAEAAEEPAAEEPAAKPAEVPAPEEAEAAAEEPAGEPAEEAEETEEPFALKDAKDVIIVPGYGMALSQAQHKVYELAEKLKANGARVRFAIHPVAGRMPGHMNVLLAEADVDYDDLFQLDEINDDFKNADAVVVVGASDVMNPAAREAEGTPIYGMPILNVDEAPHVFVCNFDLRPGYAGVENPLYSRKKGIRILLGDAKESLDTLISELK
ncbi:MAG: NAD(P)(+) transhydrogenase (Re/Si-specific) subunit beta [Lachnospiraceae bacterium]|nr:NAD(P)(+) transhydrogenase (Re/Si-specific) subunit beta [Lachnospiraceae bacterium]